jgi:RNA polymerase sigma factor (TIGR02999 family)
MATTRRADQPEINEVSDLLRAWSAGNGDALERLAPIIYPRLRAIARRQRRIERPDETLGTTALVNEAFIRLVEAGQVQWQDRAHFFAFSAQVMRRLLIDAARARLAQKRGGGQERAHPVALDDIPAASAERGKEVLALEDALLRLAQIDTRKAKVVELRFFAGLSVDQCAEILNVSAQTMLRDWRMARVWLARELNNSVG